MVKTKFMRDGKVLRRSSRNFVDKEEPPPEKAPRKGEKSRGGGGKKSETKVAPPLRTSPRKKPKGGTPLRTSPRKKPEGGTPLRTSPRKKKATVSVSKKSKKKDGSRANVSLENPEIDGGGSVPEVKKTKKKAMKKKVSKKRKRTEIEDLSPENLVNYSEEEDQLYEKEDVDPPYSQDGDEFGGVEGDDDANEREEGFEGIVEERCTDLAILGEEVRNDECEKDEDEGDDYAWDDDRIPDPMSSDEENEEDMRPAEAYREEMDPVEMLKLGRTFADAEEFKHTCLRYSLKSRYNIKFILSTSLKVGAVCAATMRKDESPCPWKIYCSFEKRKQKLMIKTYVNDHRCEVTGESKLLKRSAIASLFRERLRLNLKITAKEIESEILREYKMLAKPNSCIKAKTMVMKERRKTHEEHFDRIWDYQAEVLRSNPGSTFEIETIPGATIGRKQRFYRLYMCYKAQKESWKKTCRPVIGLDGAFLKWDIKGQLLAAIGRDGDNRIVPIAWAVVEIENETNWDWFVKLLAADLELGEGKDYVLMSDKQKGLVKAIHTVLPQAEHRQCCRHIFENWRRGGKDLRLQRLFWLIARSYTIGLYEHNLSTLEAYDAGAHKSLLATKPETWSRPFFKLGSFCNDNLNNLCEFFNKTIREMRKKPLLDLLEGIRLQCMTKNYSRSKIAAKLQKRFTKKTHQELDKTEKKSTECNLYWAIGPETEVDYKGHSKCHNNCSATRNAHCSIDLLRQAKSNIARPEKLL